LREFDLIIFLVGILFIKVIRNALILLSCRFFIYRGKLCWFCLSSYRKIIMFLCGSLLIGSADRGMFVSWGFDWGWVE
jgi:hypothetical protein